MKTILKGVVFIFPFFENVIWQEYLILGLV